MFWLYPDAPLKVGFWNSKLVMIREHHGSLRLKDFDFHEHVVPRQSSMQFDNLAATPPSRLSLITCVLA